MSTWPTLYETCRHRGLRLRLGVIPTVPVHAPSGSRLGYASVWAGQQQLIAVDTARFGGDLDQTAEFLSPWLNEWAKHTGGAA